MVTRLIHGKKGDLVQRTFQALGSSFNLTGQPMTPRAGRKLAIPDKIPYLLQGRDAGLSKPAPVWSQAPTFTFAQSSQPVTYPLGVSAGGATITMSWVSTPMTGVTFTNGVSPSITFTSATAQTSSITLRATANGQTANSTGTVTVNAVGNAAPAWSTFGPVTFYNTGLQQTYPLPVTDANNDPLTLTSVGTALPSGVTLDSANRRLVFSGTGSLATTNGHQIRADDGVSDSESDWLTRSTASGVIWAHDFSESDAELTNFVRLGSQTNPNPATLPNPLTLLSTPFGSSRAIRTRAVGTAILNDIPQDTKGASRTINVADASLFPDPATLGGSYSVYIGCSDTNAHDTNPEVFEECYVTGRNLVANTLTITRTSDSSTITVNGVDYASGSPYAPAIPASTGLYRIGFTNSGSWNRPMCAFPATQNGKSTADIGILNGAAAKQRTWNATRGGTGHSYFREGYWGSKWYYDPATNPAAPYRNWTPTYTGDGQNFSHPDAFEGDEFYLQFRFKTSAVRLQSDIAKLFFIQNAAHSGPSQLFAEVGTQYFSAQPPPSEKVAGSVVGNPLWFCASGADSRAPAGGRFASTIQTDSRDAGSVPWHIDYPSGTYPNRNTASCYTFTHQSEVWVTLLIHMKMGRCNAEAYHPNGVGSAGVSAPWPADSDASYRTLLDVRVHLPGWSGYKQLLNVTNAKWFYGDQLGAVGWLNYNGPGISTFWMTQEFNMYVGSGSLCPPNGVASAEFTQAILSRNFIPAPAV